MRKYVMLCVCLIALGGSAQNTEEKQEFKLELILDQDGETVNIDTVFTSKADMDEYMKQLDLPELGDLNNNTGNETEDVEVIKEKVDGKMMIRINKERNVEMQDSNMEVIIFEGEKMGDIEVLDHEGTKTIKKVIVVEEIEGDKNSIIEIERYITIEMLKPEEFKKADVEVKKPLSISSLEVYPNPSNGEINIGFESAENSSGTVRLRSLDGKVLAEDVFDQLNGKHELSYEGLAAGVYVLDVDAGNSNFTRKIIVK